MLITKVLKLYNVGIYVMLFPSVAKCCGKIRHFRKSVFKTFLIIAHAVFDIYDRQREITSPRGEKKNECTANEVLNYCDFKGLVFQVDLKF